MSTRAWQKLVKRWHRCGEGRSVVGVGASMEHEHASSQKQFLKADLPARGWSLGSRKHIQLWQEAEGASERFIMREDRIAEVFQVIVKTFANNHKQTKSAEVKQVTEVSRSWLGWTVRQASIRSVPIAEGAEGNICNVQPLWGCRLEDIDKEGNRHIRGREAH